MSDPVLKQSKAFAWTLTETLKRAAKRLGTEPDKIMIAPVWVNSERCLWAARLTIPGHVCTTSAYEDPITAIRRLVEQQTKGGGGNNGG